MSETEFKRAITEGCNAKRVERKRIPAFLLTQLDTHPLFLGKLESNQITFPLSSW